MGVGKLFVVGTPIGNLEDISIRALKVLRTVDFIVAEDCRVTLKLLNHYLIKKHLVSYNSFSSNHRARLIVSKLKKGAKAALVSDAGMPCISDPGEDLVSLCLSNGIVVTVVPGPCAAISALCVSGFSSSKFTFVGFLTVNKSKRFKILSQLKELTNILIFYEAPHKLINTLNDLYEYFGDRDIAIAKELTKLYEEIKITSLLKATEMAKTGELKIKGEYVLIVTGAKEKKSTSNNSNQNLSDAVDYAVNLKSGKIPASAAAKKAALKFKIKKSAIYAAMLKKQIKL